MNNYTGWSLYDFLYHSTPSNSTWIIKLSGYRLAIFYIDHEDLWARWYPEQHMDAKIKTYTYDENTMIGEIELQ